MASAKFLEEALSTDVDESVVNAIVGSLETQLVTSATSSATPARQSSTTIAEVQQLSTASNGNAIANGPPATAAPTSTAQTTTIVQQQPVTIVTAATTAVATAAVQQQHIHQHPPKIPNGGGEQPVVVDPSPPPPPLKPTTTITTNLPPVNVVNVAATSTPQNAQQQITTQIQAGQPGVTTTMQTGTFINQVVTNQSNASTATVKTEPPGNLKIIYPSGQPVIATTGIVNANNKITFPAQNVSQLANGTLAITTQAMLQTTNAVSVGQSIITTSYNPVTQVVANVNNKQQVAVGTTTGTVTNATSGQHQQQQQQQQTALVINTNARVPGMVSVPMTVATNVAATAAKSNVTSTIVPSNVQILNVNAVRPTTPVAGGQQAAPRQVAASRVVIGHNMVGARPGAPQITLQTVAGVQGGHLLVKTENGQYQLLRVGPAPTVTSQPGNTVGTNSIAGNTVVATPSAGTTTYRLASVPAVSRLNAQFTTPSLATLRKPVQTVTTNATVVTTPPTVVTAATTTVSTTPVASNVQPAQTAVASRQNTDNIKEKCRKFLANLLELSSREPKAVERNVRTLIQELIDTKVEPEEFCDRLERLLNASPQPCLIGFLRRSLPLLRQSLVTKELVIEGIKPPPAHVVFSIATAVTSAVNQGKPTVAVASSGTVPVVVTAGTGTQVRVMATALSGATATPQTRPVQIVQQKTVRPGTTAVRAPASYTVKTATVATGGIRPTTTTVTVQKPPATTIIKTVTTPVQNKIVNASSTVNKVVVPSVVPKQASKEKEKKTFSSAGYTGDDDINDVAAMGGVNLAEESQRILGSTEFVGTQIRSCKDEVFLHMSPLQQKIKQIVSKYGLEEPNQEVASLISHAAQERLKNLVEKLAVIAEHRIDLIKVDPRYEVTQDVKAQLKFLEDLDKVERKRHEEQERELLLRAAKSRAKTEDPEQAKLKAKAKEMQRAEMEELRQREANLTALQAIGPRKKLKLDTGGTGNSSTTGTTGSATTGVSGANRQLPLRPRIKRVNFKDLLFLLEQEKETCRSTTLYKAYMK